MLSSGANKSSRSNNTCSNVHQNSQSADFLQNISVFCASFLNMKNKLFTCSERASGDCWHSQQFISTIYLNNLFDWTQICITSAWIITQNRSFIDHPALKCLEENGVAFSPGANYEMQLTLTIPSLVNHIDLLHSYMLTVMTERVNPHSTKPCKPHWLITQLHAYGNERVNQACTI